MREATSDQTDDTPSETILRDRLALDRTHLANERTLLAYVRTALALAGGGVALFGLIDTTAARAVGWVLVVSGVLLLGVGLWRFSAVSRRLRRDR